MKTIIILISVYIIGLTSVFAQNESTKFNMKEKISYEIRVGLSYSTLSTTIPESSPSLQSEFEENQNTLGTNIGVLANLPFLENIYFQTGIMLSVRKIYSSVGFELPFIISYRKDITQDLKWNLNGGGSFGIMARNNDEFYAGEFAFILGTGFYYKKWHLGLQSDFGLNNIFKGRELSLWAKEDMIAKTRALSIMAGYKF